MTPDATTHDERAVGMRPPGQPVSIVTGGARGIGLAIARRLMADGHAVHVLDVLDEVGDVASSVGAAGHAQLDITDTAALEATIRRIGGQHGRLDTLVNCAGTCGRESFEHMTEQTWQRDLDTNLKATVFGCRAAVFPFMKAQGFGRLVNIASVSGKLGGVGAVTEAGDSPRSGAAYASSKAGVINATRWIARQVGAWGITANVVAPGSIASPMVSTNRYDISDLPIPRKGRPEEIAAAVAYLACDDAGFVTGDCLHVDGGLVRT